MGQQISRTTSLNIFREEINLPVYTPVSESDCKDDGLRNQSSFFTVVNDKWIESVKTHWKIPKELHVLKNGDSLKDVFESAVQVGYPVRKVKFHVLKKDINIQVNDNEKFLFPHGESYFDFMEINSQKEKNNFSDYLNKFQNSTQTKQRTCGEVKTWSDIKTVLEDKFNISVVELNQTPQSENTKQTIRSPLSNFLPIIALIESHKAVYIIEECYTHTLSDALKYSPAIFHNNHTAVLFLFYQLSGIFKQITSLGFSLSETLTLDNIQLLHSSMWLGVSPIECIKYNTNLEYTMENEKLITIYNSSNTNLSQPLILKDSLDVYTNAWCEGNLSNFDYLIIINTLAGRKFGNPLNHPVFPWVTDFTSKYGGHRDLTKTKFRLNKGDRQLDATFSTGIGNFGAFGSAQHHVSDVLSDITYYIYHARNTSKHILCSHVRSRWVPDEYPSSMERMYDWTPDECIPEFFYDVDIFKSIHSDLLDINLPEWISTPEEFVNYHYEILESNYVSRFLHHWIDLVFGYNLSGSFAKKEKNVHLSLVDGHKDLKSYGILQLFSTPHPRKRFLKDECDVDMDGTLDLIDGRTREFSQSLEWEYIDITSSIRKSKDELTIPDNSMDQEDFSLRQRTKSFTTTASAANPLDEEIPVPHVYEVTMDINDADFLRNLEDTETLLLHELSIKQIGQDGIGKYKFGSTFQNEKEQTEVESNVDYHSKLLACLLIEVAAHKELRTRTFVPDLDERLSEDFKFLQATNTSNSIRYFIEDVLDMPNTGIDIYSSSPDSIKSSVRNYMKWPSYFEHVYFFLDNFYSMISKYDHLSGEFLSEDTTAQISCDIEKTVILLQNILENINQDAVELLLSYLIPLFETPYLQVSMFLNFFVHLSNSVGPVQSKHIFMKSLQKIFDGMKNMNETMLLQQSFVSQILSSFGLESFLQDLFHFILDILTNDSVSLSPFSQKFSRASSLSTSPSLASGGNDFINKNESLLSYEVPPCYEGGEDDSISSFHLDYIFDENREVQFLSHEYTHSFTDDEVANLRLSETPTPTTPTQGRDEVDAVLQSPNTVIIDDSYFSQQQQQQQQQTDMPVLSSQELRSSSSVMIDINSESFGDFNSTIPNSSTTTAAPKKVGKSPPSYTTPIILSAEDKLTSSRLESLEEAEEVVEEIADNAFGLESSEDGKVPTAVNAYQSVVESIKWLIPWLGPTLTTQYVAKPLLKKLSKVFLEINTSSVGDRLAVDVLISKTAPIVDCLMEIALVYGDKIILDLFLKQVSQLIENAITVPSVSISLGSSLVTNVQLMVEACKVLQPESILTNIEEFSVDFFQPLIRLLSTVKPFSTGSVVKEFLSRKLIDILGLFCQKLRRETAQDVLAPLLQQFFSCFDGIYTLRTNEDGSLAVSRKYSLLYKSFEAKDKGSNRTTSVSKDILSKSLPAGRFPKFDEPDGSSFGSMNRDRSPLVSIDEILQASTEESNNIHDEQFADVYNTFSPSLAYHSYVLFCRVMGTLYVEKTLYNSDLVWHLFTKHDERLTIQRDRPPDDDEGNMKDATDGTSDDSTCKWILPLQISMDEEITTKRSNWQHLDGKWYEHWKNCQDTNDMQNLGFEDLKLQTYAGHSSVIRDFYVPDNEHYFLSASRDKTVKLWLLKNHGNGTAHLGCSRTYDQHMKAVFTVQGIETKKLVASCDGETHIWDPVSGTTVGEVKASRGHTITCIHALSAPSTCVAVATTEGHVRLYDVRQKNYAQEWKLSPHMNTGMVRSMCSSVEGTWLATGLSNGITAVLDLHAGVLRSQTRVHDHEIIQMTSVPYGFVSASVDNNVRMWHEDGTVSHLLKTSNESIHTLLYDRQQLVWGTNNNKLYIHPKGKLTSLHSYRIAQEAFKGNLSKMTLLSTNRLFLFGADNGNVILYA